MHEMSLDASSPIWWGTSASLIAGLATGLGAVPVRFLVKTVRPIMNAAMHGFGAGVMLAARASHKGTRGGIHETARSDLAVARALRRIGYSTGRAFVIALVTGLVEPVGGLLGATAMTFSVALLPWGMAFAAGAMLFVISGEIIPESHREVKGLAGTLGVLIGFIVMMLLDTIYSWLRGAALGRGARPQSHRDRRGGQRVSWQSWTA